MAPFLLSFLYSQFLVSLPYPTSSFEGQTVIVTGSNTGLGFEAAKHIARLNASRLILAIRTPSKGHAARKAIESANPLSQTTIEVWELDLSRFESVKAFAERVDTLDRLDVLLENAGMMSRSFRMVEGNEVTITINVLSTELLALLVLPKLKETAKRFRVQPRLTIVTSDLHFVAAFRERHSDDIFAALNEENIANLGDRYAVSKLMEVFFVRELAHRIKGNEGVIVNCITPGACKSDFNREATGVAKYAFAVAAAIVARSTEVGSRTLVAGAAAGKESNGEYMADCVVARPAPLVESEEGKELQGRLWAETMKKLEKIQPGISRSV